uniref:DUF4283 domain-containing protein n=1 Tax=Solanum tuberosum TaxID=4113 RepID=M1DUX9_SOLTU
MSWHEQPLMLKQWNESLRCYGRLQKQGGTRCVWRKNDVFSKIYCARNYNKYGRYISLINIKARRRAVIIILELTLNSGWSGIAEKIEKFISSHKYVGNIGVHELMDKKISYAKILRSIKWANKRSNGHREEGTVKRGDRIYINDDASLYSEVLKKSLVGKFVTTKGELPALADIRRWVTGLWKHIHGMNIYEMGNGYFLFKFSSIITAEQVVEGDWSWRNSPVLFQWWNPTICTSSTTKSARTTRIRIVGLPLQFWSQSTFKAIRDFCGGWIETEEETQLRNHLKWARIKVEGDGSNVPREVTIDDGSLWYTMQIWTESPARVVAGEDQIQKAHLKVDTTQRSIRFIPKVCGRDCTLSKDKSVVADQPRDIAETFMGGLKSPTLTVGQETLDHGPKINLGLNFKGGQDLTYQFKGKTCEWHENLSKGTIESLTSLKTLATQFLNVFSAWESASMENRIEPTSNSEQRENFNKQQNAIVQSRVDSSLGNQLQEAEESSKLPEDIDVEQCLQIQQIHDVEPVSMNMPEVQQDVGGEASQWINAHIMELNANYGVAFEGFRDETHALLMRIDERKAALENKKSDNLTATPKNRGIGKYELKNLQSCLNQQLEGSRTKGTVLNLTFK